jgi:serine/threonine protein phosphatase PrpC
MMKEAGVYEKNASSVREYAYYEDKNYRFRPAMEDSKLPYFLITAIAHCVKDRLGNDPHSGLFGVFDGHGGKQVADHCAERMPEEIRKEAMKNPGDLSYAIEQVFLRVRIRLVLTLRLD